MSTTEQTPQPATPKKRSKVFIIVLGLLVLAGTWFGLTKYFHAQHHEETDDAQVEANISPVMSRINGYVQKVYVQDNQFVHKGDTCLHSINVISRLYWNRPKPLLQQQKVISMRQKQTAMPPVPVSIPAKLP